MGELTQISLVYLSQERCSRGERPVFELNLQPHQTIVGFHNYWRTDLDSRETVDHHANVWVASRL